MNITIADIANRVGCSPSTVSRALNGTAGVEPQLRRRILVAARALDSGGRDASEGPRRGRPRGSLRRAGTVNVIVFRREEVEPLILSANHLSVAPLTEATTNLFFSPRLRLVTDFYRHVINGIVSVLAANSIKSIQQIRNDLLDESFLDGLRASRPCGVLLLGEPDPQVQAFVDRCGCPVVLVDILGISGPPVVAIDNMMSVALALRHLLALGHRDIGFVGNPENPSFRERFLSFFGGMTEAGLSVSPEWHYRGSGHIRDIAEGLQPILKARRRPTAMLCACDHYAIGVFEAARIAALRIPEDLSVVGFDDIEAAPLMSPPLTTVRVPKIQLGACAADLLLRLTSANRAPEILQHCEVRCRTEMVIRASTGPAARNRAPTHARHERNENKSAPPGPPIHTPDFRDNSD
jgi:DNA-binding LacI/PurR family transcriptional regulator